MCEKDYYELQLHISPTWVHTPYQDPRNVIAQAKRSSWHFLWLPLAFKGRQPNSLFLIHLCL